MRKILTIVMILSACKVKEVRESKSILEKSYLLESLPLNLGHADFQVTLDGKPDSQFSVFRSLENDRYVVVLRDQQFSEMLISANNQQFIYNVANPIGWKAIQSYEFRIRGRSPCAQFVHPDRYDVGFFQVELIWSSRAYAISYNSYCDVSFENFWLFTGN